MSTEMPVRRKVIGGPFIAVIVISACLLVCSGIAGLWFHQKSVVQSRIQNLLLKSPRLEFFIPIVRQTHSRIIEDRAAISGLAKLLIIRGWKRMDGSLPSAGGTAVYIEPVDEPRFLMIVGSEFLFVRFTNGESYACHIEPETALKHAAAIANFAYPIMSDIYPPDPQNDE